MDSFIALGAFLSLWGSLLASQTKASVCPSSQRPGWDPSSTPVAEGSASTSVLAVFERKTRTPLFTFKNSSGPTVFVCYAQFLFGAEAGVCEMHSRCLSSCPHSQDKRMSSHSLRSGVSFTLLSNSLSFKPTSRLCLAVIYRVTRSFVVQQDLTFGPGMLLVQRLLVQLPFWTVPNRQCSLSLHFLLQKTTPLSDHVEILFFSVEKSFAG